MAMALGIETDTQMSECNIQCKFWLRALTTKSPFAM